MTYFVEVSVQQAAAQILIQPDVLILDSRDAYSYKDDHIDGAMQAHGGLVEHLISRQEFDRPILVYCYQGNSSKDLAEVFGRAGFKHSYSLKGGFTAWKKHNAAPTQTTFSATTKKWLEKNGFERQSINQTYPYNSTPLILACQQGEQTVALELISAGADTEQKNSDGNTALWAACYANNLPIIESLLRTGTNIDSQNIEGVSALMYAASAGKTEVVATLLSAGANSELKSHDDYTALDLSENRSILKLLAPTKSIQ